MEAELTARGAAMARGGDSTKGAKGKLSLQGEVANTPWEICLKPKTGREFTNCRLQHHRPANSPAIRPTRGILPKTCQNNTLGPEWSQGIPSLSPVSQGCNVTTLHPSYKWMLSLEKMQDLLGRPYEARNIFIQRRLKLLKGIV